MSGDLLEADRQQWLADLRWAVLVVAGMLPAPEASREIQAARAQRIAELAAEIFEELETYDNLPATR